MFKIILIIHFLFEGAFRDTQGHLKWDILGFDSVGQNNKHFEELTLNTLGFLDYFLDKTSYLNQS